VRALGRAKTKAFARGLLGRILPAITLSPERGGGRALTDNFLNVTLRGPCEANRLVRVKIEGVTGERIQASVADQA
jgi:hypothetical protein